MDSAVAWKWIALSILDWVIDVPFLLLAGLTFKASDHPSRGGIHVTRWVVRMIEAGISISLPLALLMLGILVVGHSPVVGVISVIGSMVGYGLRNTLCQGAQPSGVCAHGIEDSGIG
jgi:hypothetical protein